MTRRRPAQLRSVFERTLHDERRALAGWLTGLAGLGLVMLAVYPSVHHNQEISRLVAGYPRAFRSLFGISDYASGPGYLRAEVFSLTGPLLVVIMAVLWGADALAGEEDRRTIDLLLANPVSRRQVVLEKWAAVALAVGGASLGLGVVLAAGGPLAGLHVGSVPLFSAVVATMLLGVLFATVALAVGAATGRRGLARGVATLLAVAAYLASTLPDLVSWLRPVRPLSPWYHALGVDPLTAGFLPLHLLVLIAMTGLSAGAAIVAFDRRDLAV